MITTNLTTGKSCYVVAAERYYISILKLEFVVALCSTIMLKLRFGCGRRPCLVGRFYVGFVDVGCAGGESFS